MMLRSGLDQCIARMYWIEGLTQEQLAMVLHLTQCAISKRLKSILLKLRFIIQTPSLDPIQVKSDLESLLEGEDREIIEIAYLQFFEGSLSRTATILGISPTRVSSYMKQIIQTLAAKAIEGGVIAEKYFQYYKRAMNSAGVLQNHYKKNDRQRIDSLVRGESILK
jgi:predicted XRE-type DNA-binding protein